MSNATTSCTVCHRVLRAEDADAEGRCVHCRPTPKPTKVRKAGEDAQA